MFVGQGPKLSDVADEKYSRVIAHSRNHGGGFFQGECGNGNIYGKTPLPVTFATRCANESKSHTE